MNILRKALATEAAQLKPLLDRSYHEIHTYQRSRTVENEQRLREALAPTIQFLMLFKPYMPTYKQADFELLEAAWSSLQAGDLIMLFDHCVSIMHSGGRSLPLRDRRAATSSAAGSQQPLAGSWALPGWR